MSAATADPAKTEDSTGVTRAGDKLTIVGSREMVEAAIKAPVRRATGPAEWLRASDAVGTGPDTASAGELERESQRIGDPLHVGDPHVFSLLDIPDRGLIWNAGEFREGVSGQLPSEPGLTNLRRNPAAGSNQHCVAAYTCVSFLQGRAISRDRGGWRREPSSGQSDSARPQGGSRHPQAALCASLP